MRNGFVVLDEESLDFRELTGVGTIVGEELCDDREWSGGIDLELRAWAVEVADSHSVWVQIAAVFVADSLVPLVGGVVSAVCTGACLLAIKATWMSGVGSGNRVGLPDIHFSAARSDFTEASIWVAWRWVPAFGVGFSVDELDVMWALSITISSSVASSSSISWECCLSSIFRHLNEVKSSIETARHV